MLIDFEEIKHKLNSSKWYGTQAWYEILNIIGDCDDKSRPTGVWVGIDEEPHEEWECCNCGNIINTYMQDELEEYKYCHKCGAEMSTPWAEKRGEE